MLVLVFFVVMLATKDVDTPVRRGVVDQFGRGVAVQSLPVDGGAFCAHVNCEGQVDPLLLTVRSVSDDEVVIESVTGK